MTKNEWLKVINSACDDFGFYDSLGGVEVPNNVRMNIAEHYYHEMFNNITVYNDKEEVAKLDYLTDAYARAYMSMTDTEEFLEVLHEYLE
jgi:hypothetical protein